MPIENTAPPGQPFLVGFREQVASGQSVYGEIGSYNQVRKLEELDAKIAHARSQGEMPPAPEWTPERIATDRVNALLPRGLTPDDLAGTIPEHVIEAHAWALGQLDAMSPSQLAAEIRRVEQDVEHNTSRVTLPYSSRLGDAAMSGKAQVDALVAEAEPVLRQIAKDDGTSLAEAKRLVRANRPLLEACAARARSASQYRAAINPTPRSN